LTSYHVHTRWSDGSATIQEVINAAEAVGLEEVGISDHYVMYPDLRRVDWSMPTERLEEYAAEVREAGRHARVTVRLGLEVDYLPDTIERTLEALARVDFDYVIGSVHFVDDFALDSTRDYWDALTQDQVDEMWKAYYRRLGAMTATRGFDIVGHFDLPKKFGVAPHADLTPEVLEALDAVAESGMVMEINTSGWHRPVREAYPAPWIAAEARKRNVPIVITADAHDPKNLVRDFDRAADLARQAGYTSAVRFEARRRYRTELD